MSDSVPYLALCLETAARWVSTREGAETSLRISTPAKEKRGKADTVYGSAVIEFERSLKHTLAEAERQLQEYVAGIWQSDPTSRRSLDAVATNGLRLRIYRPVISGGG